MGLKFCNEAIIALKQIWPITNDNEELSPLQVGKFIENDNQETDGLFEEGCYSILFFCSGKFQSNAYHSRILT